MPKQGLENYSDSVFENIKHINEYGQEFGYARELQTVLEYTEWRNFSKVIDHAVEAYRQSKNDVDSHFVEVNKMISLGSGTQRQINDYELSRYACYLIVIHLAVLEASEDKIMA